MFEQANAFNNHPLNAQLRPWVDAWLLKLRAAREAKKAFNATAKEVRTFFNVAERFWDDKKTWDADNQINPRFRMRLSKAYEFVTIVGPMLFWRYPQCLVQPRLQAEPLQLLMPDPNQYQAAMQQYQVQYQISKYAAELQQRVLNWLPHEQSGGGLEAHARRAVTDALLTGRGCLWSKIETKPGAATKLCGMYYDSVDHLLIDADCTMPDFSDGQFIVQEVTEPAHMIERAWGLPKGALKGCGSSETSSSISETPADRRAQDRKDGKTHNLVTYYRIWSKCGVGARFKEQDAVDKWNQPLLDSLDQQVGDYVFLVVVPNLPYPVNLPGARLAQMTVEQVQASLRWPTEHWRDGDWPVAVLDFTEDPQSPWPVAPMRASLGWMSFLSVMLSCLCDRAYANSQDILAVNGAVYDNVMEALSKVGFPKVIQLDQVVKTIGEALQFMQPPTISPDVLTAIEFAMAEFEKSSGLMDLMYGQTATQDRSAAASQTKHEQTQIRPDDMAARVEKWMTTAMNSLRLMSKTYLTGQDVLPLLGQFGAQAWDQIIVPMPLDAIISGTDVTVEAHSTRKPNKATQIENTQQGMQVLMGLFTQYSQATGNMEPVNELIKRFCAAMDWDPNGLMFPPPSPPDPAQQQQEQQAQQMAMQQEQVKMQAIQAKAQADILTAQIKSQIAQQEHQLKMQEMQADLAKQQAEAQIDGQRLAMEQSGNQQEAQVKQQALLMRLEEQAAKAQIKNALADAPNDPLEGK